MRFIQSMRSLVLGETWTLPIGIGLAVGAAAAIKELSGPADWWPHEGGLLLMAGLVLALVLSLRTPR
jgi:hypothetical protein